MMRDICGCLKLFCRWTIEDRGDLDAICLRKLRASCTVATEELTEDEELEVE